MFKMGDSYIKECQACTLSSCERREMCAICTTQKIIRGKWKFVILWLLREKPMRFSEILKALPSIKQGPLSTQLKDLESIGVINRKSYNEVPPRVEYSLTQSGTELMSIIMQMKDWSEHNLVTFEDIK